MTKNQNIPSLMPLLWVTWTLVATLVALQIVGGVIAWSYIDPKGALRILWPLSVCVQLAFLLFVPIASYMGWFKAKRTVLCPECYDLDEERSDCYRCNGAGRIEIVHR